MVCVDSAKEDGKKPDENTVDGKTNADRIDDKESLERTNESPSSKVPEDVKPSVSETGKSASASPAVSSTNVTATPRPSAPQQMNAGQRPSYPGQRPVYPGQRPGHPGQRPQMSGPRPMQGMRPIRASGPYSQPRQPMRPGFQQQSRMPLRPGIPGPRQRMPYPGGDKRFGGPQAAMEAAKVWLGSIKLLSSKTKFHGSHTSALRA